MVKLPTHGFKHIGKFSRKTLLWLGMMEAKSGMKMQPLLRKVKVCFCCGAVGELAVKECWWSYE